MFVLISDSVLSVFTIYNTHYYRAIHQSHAILTTTTPPIHHRRPSTSTLRRIYLFHRPTALLLHDHNLPYCIGNSSQLANVSATALFDPIDASTYMLRLIGPGYPSLPRFTLSNRVLQTQIPDMFNQGNYTYSSQSIISNADLEFVQRTSGGSELSFMGDENLLRAIGSAVGWTIITDG